MISHAPLFPSSTSISSPLLLPALSPSPTLREIQQLHAQSLKLNHFHHNPSLPTSLISSCCSSFQSSPPKSLHDIHYALSLLNHTTHASSFHYNTLIKALNQMNQPHQAFLLFYRLLHDNENGNGKVLPDKYTYTFVLKSCEKLCGVEEGRQVHCLALKSGFVLDLFVGNCLIHMYNRCGDVDDAYKVFDEMLERNVANVVSWNCLIDGFVKVGNVDGARRVFDEMPARSIVSWNSMIAGCAKEGLVSETLDMFIEMQISGFYPDETTLMSIISVVSDLGLLCLGKRIHGYIIRKQFPFDGDLGAAVIDMYSKCGSVYSALRVFENTQTKNVGHWTSMIVGLAFHGYAEASLILFSEMLNAGVKPNHVTFVGVLSACSHGGLVEQGIRHFNLMRTYDVEPRIQHYGCLVDLLGRANLIQEAKILIDKIPMEPGIVIWSTLLAACRNHGDIETGEIAAKKLIELTPDYGGGYVLLSNLYADSYRWMDSGRTRRVMDERGVEKVAGLSWIEVDGKLHEFLAGDRIHPKNMEIYGILDELQCKLGWEME
ncbi:hypothetical protein ACHQM5_004842 [Ranunculus cassubicifolius]